MTNDLKPCPFCGGEAKVHGPYGWYQRWCISHSCKAFYSGTQDHFSEYPKKDYAIAAWNTRADADRIEALTAENERLRNDHACAVAELNKTKALLKGYRRGYKTARAALGDA